MSNCQHRTRHKNVDGSAVQQSLSYIATSCSNRQREGSSHKSLLRALLSSDTSSQTSKPLSKAMARSASSALFLLLVATCAVGEQCCYGDGSRCSLAWRVSPQTRGRVRLIRMLCGIAATSDVNRKSAREGTDTSALQAQRWRVCSTYPRGSPKRPPPNTMVSWPHLAPCFSLARLAWPDLHAAHQGRQCYLLFHVLRLAKTAS